LASLQKKLANLDALFWGVFKVVSEGAGSVAIMAKPFYEVVPSRCIEVGAGR
jgi:hypothetical protein